MYEQYGHDSRRILSHSLIGRNINIENGSSAWGAIYSIRKFDWYVIYMYLLVWYAAMLRDFQASSVVVLQCGTVFRKLELVTLGVYNYIRVHYILVALYTLSCNIEF